MNPRFLMTMLTFGAALLMPWQATAEDGAAVFKANCAKCHGDSGNSDTSAGKTLKVPKLKGDAKIAGMSDADIVALVKGNSKHKSFITKLSDEQVGAAAGHVKQLAGGK